MEHLPNLLFITFTFTQQGRELQVRCRGCREIMILDYQKPTHIRGLIEFDGKYIPVIDPNIQLFGEPTKLNTSSCILIVEHRYDCQKLHTGILIENFEEIMQLAASSFKLEIGNQASVNMHFILEAHNNDRSNKLLFENYRALDICETQKREEEDFEAFKNIQLREPFHV
ncbi:MAG: chemotaxis protein CheW [Phycisphaerales bacterium]|jgi:chemotaxis signal transduction protein